MKTPFQLWLAGLLMIIFIATIIYVLSYSFLPKPISFLEAWGLVMLFVITKSGIELYQEESA